MQPESSDPWTRDILERLRAVRANPEVQIERVSGGVRVLAEFDSFLSAARCQTKSIKRIAVFSVGSIAAAFSADAPGYEHLCFSPFFLGISICSTLLMTTLFVVFIWWTARKYRYIIHFDRAGVSIEHIFVGDERKLRLNHGDDFELEPYEHGYVRTKIHAGERELSLGAPLTDDDIEVLGEAIDVHLAR
jgi:hypothetical protein